MIKNKPWAFLIANYVFICAALALPGFGQGLSRSAPVPLGQELLVPEGWSISVAGLNTDAYSAILAANQFNSAPQSGDKFVMIKIKAVNRQAGALAGINIFDFQAVGSTGLIRDSCFGAVLPQGLPISAQVFQDGSVEGNLCFEMQQSEADIVLVTNISSASSSRRYFATLTSQTQAAPPPPPPPPPTPTPTPTPVPTPVPTPTPAVQAYSPTTSKRHVFPQFADGAMADGSSYRSSLLLSNPSATARICILSTYGVSPNFGTGPAANTTIQLIAREARVLKSSGSGVFSSGLAELECDQPVDAQLLFSLYGPGGVKLSEAAIFSAVESNTVEMIADQREGASLGIAIANDTLTASTYTVSSYSLVGNLIEQKQVTVPALTSSARFIHDILTGAGTDFLGKIQISNSSASGIVDVIGLRFTGAVFVSIPANMRGQ